MSICVHGSDAVKKGRHRRYEEARALKRSPDINLDELLESLKTDESRPAWADDDDDDLDDDLADRYADEFDDEEDDED
jgi:hypothetical protein